MEQSNEQANKINIGKNIPHKTSGAKVCTKQTERKTTWRRPVLHNKQRSKQMIPLYANRNEMINAIYWEITERGRYEVEQDGEVIDTHTGLSVGNLNEDYAITLNRKTFAIEPDKTYLY